MVNSSRLEASDRVTLLMSFVPYLLEHGPVSIDELAQHFDITTTQVEEIVQLLAMSGIPGDNGFYQHSDLFDINWDLFENEAQVELWSHVGVEATPRFSAREAAALVAGLQYISGIVPDSDKEIISTLLKKISAGASAAPENLLISAAEMPVDVDVITTAVASEKSIRFRYRNGQGIEQVRTVDPLRLDLVGPTWYLRSWCHDRQALRTFRLDRISELELSEQKFSSPVSTNELTDQLFDVSETDLRVQFHVDTAALPLISAYNPQIVSQLDEESVAVEVSFANLESVPIFVAQVPGLIRVISPSEAVTAVQDWANQALARYTA
ncbi:helix-turn-helix transcriptional regulator [Aurantimicrobium minutum]|uniref:DeoR family transcriptional regulator n=1 Tax=Aurantimicrobium minutum TaxID=708131 RepID=A0A173LWB8_9MICO|nr:WYL domain-containing protein [Aurantimicrobium minutum]BAU99134.1 DeoR family transcriptional regulator [Aurantimicrobium minutum]